MNTTIICGNLRSNHSQIRLDSERIYAAIMHEYYYHLRESPYHSSQKRYNVRFRLFKKYGKKQSELNSSWR